MARQAIYQFYTELEEYKPKMWRRIQVVGSITVARLGYILMTLYEMQGSHLFSFDIPVGEEFRAGLQERMTPENIDELFTPQDFERVAHCEIIDENYFDFAGDDVPVDAIGAKLKDYISHPGISMYFTYDFGDNWEIRLELEKVFQDEQLQAKELPRVLEGAGFGIVENCGGVYGLEELAKAFKKKKGTAYNNFREWLGVAELNLEGFDLDDMNFRLKKIPRIYMQLYEQHLVPTKQSIDLLERKYRNNKTR